jgi:hypothetical protein
MPPPALLILPALSMKMRTLLAVPAALPRVRV